MNKVLSLVEKTLIDPTLTMEDQIIADKYRDIECYEDFETVTVNSNNDKDESYVGSFTSAVFYEMQGYEQRGAKHDNDYSHWVQFNAF